MATMIVRYMLLSDIRRHKPVFVARDRSEIPVWLWPLEQYHFQWLRDLQDYNISREA